MFGGGHVPTGGKGPSGGVEIDFPGNSLLGGAVAHPRQIRLEVQHEAVERFGVRFSAEGRHRESGAQRYYRHGDDEFQKCEAAMHVGGGDGVTPSC